MPPIKKTQAARKSTGGIPKNKPVTTSVTVVRGGSERSRGSSARDRSRTPDRSSSRKTPPRRSTPRKTPPRTPARSTAKKSSSSSSKKQYREVSRSPTPFSDPETESEIEEDAQERGGSSREYEVEEIVGKAYGDDQVYYEVKWKGYPKTTIEPLTNLADSLLLVSRYEYEMYQKKSQVRAKITKRRAKRERTGKKYSWTKIRDASPEPGID